MGINQVEDDTCSLIMECSVEELSEVQLDYFLESKKAYEQAVVKANRKCFCLFGSVENISRQLLFHILSSHQVSLL